MGLSWQRGGMRWRFGHAPNDTRSSRAPRRILEDALLAELVIRDVEDIARHAPARDATASPDVFHSDRGSTG